MKFELKELERTVRKSEITRYNFSDLLSFHDRVSEDTQSKTLTALNAKHHQLTLYTKHGYKMYIYLVLTTKLYIKRHLKTVENTPFEYVINLTTNRKMFEKRKRV